MKYRHVAIKEDYNERLERIASIYSMNNKGKMVEIMLDYFERTGADPLSDNKNDIQAHLFRIEKEIAKSRETTVSFIRQQEKSLLRPIIEQVNENTKQLLVFFGNGPLTINHLEELKNLKSPNQNVVSNNIDVIEIKEKANKVITESKELFNKFIETGQKSSLTKKVTFEESIITMYKNQFQLLNFK